jgi:adenylate cyclase class 2
MQTEFEVKFCGLDHDDVRQRLIKAGAKLVEPMRTMRRIIFDYPDNRLQAGDAYVRLRDEGDKVTITYKHFPAKHEIGGAREIETTVSSFEQTKELFKAIGLIDKSYQESRRETWELDGGEVVLDEWPWLKPYIEIEAESEEKVREMTAKLGYDWEDAVFGDVVVAYRLEYDVPSKKLGQSTVRFDDPRPDWMLPKQP